MITSWAFEADGSPPPSIKLKVARPEGGNVFTIMGESAAATPGANAVSTYPARIPVNAGEVLGYFYSPVGVGCLGTTALDIVRYIGGDQPPGTTVAFPNIVAAKLDISAILEPDCDADGFGDETQDSDLASCAPDTSIPNATITKGPKDKTKKKSATFEFTGTDTRAVASFQCSLDGGAFAACTSPYTVKVKKGKHTFSVRAVDQAGNVGAPASDDWKVKKKTRK